MENRDRVEAALRAFGAGCERAEHHFDLLFRDAEQVLARFFGLRGVRPEDAQDMIQSIRIRIWSNRERLIFKSVPQWYSYLYESARNSRSDLAAAPVAESQIKDVPAEERILPMIASAVDRQNLYELADAVWLGTAPPDASAKQLAAHYLYVEGKSTAEVFTLVCRSTATTKPKSPQRLEEWIGDVSILRRTSYQTLYIPSDRLVAIVIGLPDASSVDLDALQRLLRKDQKLRIGAFVGAELDLIFLRFRYGMPLRQALSKLADRLSESEAASTSARCAARFPFVQIMVSLWTRMAKQPLRAKALGENALWKRLVFQYHCVHELPQDDILMRVSGAAAVAGYALNNINTWIASRLLNELHHANEADR